MKRVIGCGLLLIVVLGVGGLYGYYSYRPWAKVDDAEGRLQLLRNRVPMQWRVAEGLTVLDEAWMTPTSDEWHAMKYDPVEGEPEPTPAEGLSIAEVRVLASMAGTAALPGPLPEAMEARVGAMEPILARLARGRLVRPDSDVSGSQLDDVVRWMAWRAWVADDCLAAALDGIRVAQGHTLLGRGHTGTWWTESLVLRVLEPRLIECAHDATPDRVREAADALLRIDSQREAIIVDLRDHIFQVEQTLTIASNEVRNVWVPHLHVDPTLEELELRLSTAEALADTGSLLDVRIPRNHPQWEDMRIQRDSEISLRVEYQLLVSALRLVAGDEPDAVHPLNEEPVQSDESRVFWGHSSIDPDGRDEVVVWNPAVEAELAERAPEESEESDDSP